MTNLHPSQEGRNSLEERDAELPISSNKQQHKIELLAFYLPQFHPTPENDAWWGKGFTEWTNSTKAQPLFDGHYQPHLPADLGFYDLRLRETRREQIALAKQYGIDGFCYHYYWFSGKRVLDQPLDDMLADPGSDMPFCLCWANENWTRRWDGADHQILLEQKYLADDAINFIKDLTPYLKDKRYITLGGNPLLIVYAPQHIPNAANTLNVWRDYCRKEGIGELHLCAALTHQNTEFKKYGFDSAVEFPPHNLRGCENVSMDLNFSAPFYGNVFAYEDVANTYLTRDYQDKNIFHTVFPSWDNTARTGSRAITVLDGSPANYEYWLSETLAKTRQKFPEQRRFVFINAWNEWAEGCHLEPDQMYQRGFLEATLRAKQGKSNVTAFENRLLLESFQQQERRKFLQDLFAVVHYHLAVVIGKTRKFVNRYPKLKASLVPIVRIFKRLMPTR